MRPLPAIFALLVAAIGWYYLFYSRAAQRLEHVEDERSNRLRGLLRRINAIVMLLMAVVIAYGLSRFDRPGMEVQFLLTWVAVMFLLLLCVVLALIDVRLTWKLRRTLRERNRSS
jgi:Na+/H+ antiporter NhaD/arsenite permease-like protein